MTSTEVSSWRKRQCCSWPVLRGCMTSSGRSRRLSASRCTLPRPIRLQRRTTSTCWFSTPTAFAPIVWTPWPSGSSRAVERPCCWSSMRKISPRCAFPPGSAPISSARAREMPSLRSAHASFWASARPFRSMRCSPWITSLSTLPPTRCRSMASLSTSRSWSIRC